MGRKGILGILLLGLFAKASSAGDEHDHVMASRLRASLAATEAELRRIGERWQVQEFPVFLKSGWMPNASYNILRERFRHAILSSFHTGTPYELLVTFTGSSVTAGHDCFFNESYPVVVGKTMKAAVEASGVRLEVHNAAMGNNRCIPYDVCVNTFTGGDSDIVMWEQSYDCNPTSVGPEQLIRQSLVSGGGKVPIIALAGSATPNWAPETCENVSTKALPLTSDLAELQGSGWRSGMRKTVTELNAGNKGKFGDLDKLLELYPSAGIQTFFHEDYEPFKCRGPYVPEWKGRNVWWHPSRLGHMLRADQIAFVWLSIWRDVVSELLAVPRLKQLKKAPLPPTPPTVPVLPAPHFASAFVDGQQCFTDYEPRFGSSVNSTSIHGRTVSGNLNAHIFVPPDTDPKATYWRRSVYEYFKFRGLIETTRRMGYLDLKVVVYGNNYSGPISFAVEFKKPGHVFLCSVPHLQLGNIFEILHDQPMQTGLSMHVTYTPRATFFNRHRRPFVFDPNKAKKLEYSLGLDRCIQSNDPVTPGAAILTISPAANDTKFILLSTLLVP